MPLRFVALVAACCVIAQCNVGQRQSPKDASPRDERVDLLREKEVLVLAELADASDKATGWPSAVDCDALLWAGLAAAVGAPVDIAQAEYSPGEMHRRPRPPCWTPDGGDQGSKSSISRDMLLGYLWALWERADVGAMQRLASYGEEHSWVMGGGDPARIGMGPNLKGLLGRMLEKVRGGTRDYRLLPTTYLPGGKDYERHLAMLGLLLEGEVKGGLYQAELAALEAVADDHDDALASAARGSYSGDMTRALELLLSDAYAPPSYVRGAAAYRHVHWLFAAEIVLRRY